jgi:RNA polymerase sigma-70 factor (family 1)
LFAEPPYYNEKKLLGRIATGDAEAFEQVYQYYQPKLYAYILHVVKSPAFAQDLQQEVFVKIWEVRDRLPGVRTFGAWLFFIARNHTINAMKAAARSSTAMGEVLRHYPEPGYDDAILDRDYERYIHQVLQSLPERTREIYRRCREQGKTYEEVGRELGISGNAVKRHMVNSIRVLQEAARKGLGLSPGVAVFFAWLVAAMRG